MVATVVGSKCNTRDARSASTRPQPLERQILSFGAARFADVPRLVQIYNAAWIKEKYLRALGLNDEQIREVRRGLELSDWQLKQALHNCQKGQIVGCLDGRPATMITTMLHPINSIADIKGGYAKVTGDRTFSTHVPLAQARTQGKAVLEYCVSITVDPQYDGTDFSIQTLDYAIKLSEKLGVLACPYSAPRGYAAFNKGFKGALNIFDYLHFTRPREKERGKTISYENYLQRLAFLSTKPLVKKLYPNGLPQLTEEIFREEINKLESPSSIERDENGLTRITLFSEFKREWGEQFKTNFGREMTVEDYCWITGRRLTDPVMELHVGNGARFIRDAQGRIACVFADSRPEDVVAQGYNIVLTYGYHPLLFGNLSL